MKRSVNEYDENRGGGLSPLAYVPPAVGLGGMAFAKKKQIDMAQEAGDKDRREAAAEMKRETRGVQKPSNFDAMEEAKQEVQDAKARAKIKAMGYAGGGKVSSASKRADGCATKGKTKGTMITMYGGGKC
jgi:hypothetical protein